MTSICSSIRGVLDRWLAEPVVIARSVTHVLAEILSITCHFFFICQNIFIWFIWSGREIFLLLMYLSIFEYIFAFSLTKKIRAQVNARPL